MGDLAAWPRAVKGARRSCFKGHIYLFRIIPKMFHVKHFGKIAAQRTRGEKTAVVRRFVRPAAFYVRLRPTGTGKFLLFAQPHKVRDRPSLRT
jgi:hypothetical protein